MTEAEATEFVIENWENDQVSDDEVEDCFRALYGREPDEDDITEGLWSHCCAAVAGGDIQP